jgi:PleD family two-component response regulator
MISLVEDEAIARYALAQMLSLSGYKVMAAADGEHAFELLERHPFDVYAVPQDSECWAGFKDDVYSAGFFRAALRWRVFGE